MQRRESWAGSDRVGGKRMPKTIIQFIKRHAWVLVLSAAILAGAYGLYRGEAVEVFEKARTICLECIGIG